MHPFARLGFLDGVAMLVGIVVGMGIFRSPAIVAQAAGGPEAALALWALGGLITFLGALTYAELASAYPQSAGEYGYLRRAYGTGLARLFGWARLSVIQPGSIAGGGFVIGDYLTPYLNLGPHSAALYAALATLAVTALNLRGLTLSAGAQRALASALIAALGALIVIGLFAPAAAPSPAAAPTGAPAIGFALIFILFTYGGWNEAAYLAGETDNPQRRMIWILLGGVGLVTALYLAINAIYFRVLGFEGTAGAAAVGASLAQAVLGPAAAAVVTVFVLAASLSTMNGSLFTGARSAEALGADAPALARLNKRDAARQAPIAAVLAQAGASLALIALAPSAAGFETMAAYTAPVFWLFFLLSAFAAIVLRWRDPGAARPFRIPLFPLPPLLFCASAGFMLYSSLTYAGSQAFSLGVGASLVVLAAGALFLAVDAARRRGRG